jgi:hypothetical protein
MLAACANPAATAALEMLTPLFCKASFCKASYIEESRYIEESCPRRSSRTASDDAVEVARRLCTSELRGRRKRTIIAA